MCDVIMSRIKLLKAEVARLVAAVASKWLLEELFEVGRPIRSINNHWICQLIRNTCLKMVKGYSSSLQGLLENGFIVGATYKARK